MERKSGSTEYPADHSGQQVTQIKPAFEFLFVKFPISL